MKPYVCVGCGEPIRGNHVIVGEADGLVVRQVTDPGPHCSGCYTTAREEDEENAVKAMNGGGIKI